MNTCVCCRASNVYYNMLPHGVFVCASVYIYYSIVHSVLYIYIYIYDYIRPLNL